MPALRCRCFICSAGFALSLLAGCTTFQPWERGTLARPVMTPVDPVHETTQKERTYSAKEGGAAATGVGGGGCGCN
jgi:hypothetical protein